MDRPSLDTILVLAAVGFALVGIALVSVGVLFQQAYPWITFKKGVVLLPPNPKPWRFIFYEVSPFLLQYQFDEEEIHVEWFYKTDALMVGMMCAIGVITSIIGVLVSRWKLLLLGGSLSMFTLIAFGTCLPGLYPYISWSIGAQYTFYGSILILVASAVSYHRHGKKYDKIRHIKLIESWR